MTTFLIIAAVMVVAAAGWILWPLLRPGDARAVEHAAANVSIFKDQFADLEVDLARGTLSADQHAEAKAELERRLLDDVRASPTTRGERRSHRWAAAAVALITPIAAAGLYWQIGTPEALSGVTTTARSDGPPTREQIDTMIVDLKQRLDKEPDNIEAWALLARTHYAVGDFAQSAAAYARLSVLLPNDADLMADHADAIAMSRGRNFAGEPMQLVRRALSIDPTQWKALAMAGAEAFEQKNYGDAIDYWQRLQKVTPPDLPIAKQLQEGIDQARRLSLSGTLTPQTAEGTADPAAKAGRSVSGTVTLSSSLLSKVKPDDSVFIYARPPDGSRMPVAVVRARASELPLQFTLDDSRAMAPTAKISNLAEVIVSARVSRSGNAIPTSGDLEAATEKVKVGSQGIAITIDRAVP